MSQPPAFSPGSDTGALNSRRLNRQRLLDAIRRLGPISRADLAKRTRLSPPTVSALVDELVGEGGLLREIGIGVSSGGRPPMLLEFNAEFGYLVGVDLDSRFVRIALADMQGRLLARHEAPARVQPPGHTIHQVLEGIDAVVRESGRDPRKVFAIGIGVPGAIDATTGRLLEQPDLPGLANVQIRDVLQARFRAPVCVDTNANMAALGEQWLGAARNALDFVFVALGDVVGAAIVVAGRLHRGHRWCAGGIGRMTLDYRQWEVDHGPAGYLASRIGGEDGVVHLGTAIANVVAMLDPCLVVLGGRLGGFESRLGDVRHIVATIVPNPPPIEVAALGADAPLLGSVHSAMALAETQLFAIAGSPGGLSGGPRRAGARH